MHIDIYMYAHVDAFSLQSTYLKENIHQPSDPNGVIPTPGPFQNSWM